VKVLLSDMMIDISSYTNDKSIVEGFVDLMIIFRIDFLIQRLYPFTELLQEIEF
jgi:hypothetical protein